MHRTGKLSPARIVLLAAATSALLAAACSSDAKTTTATTATTSMTGSLTVFAAASLTEAFDEHKTTLEAGNPGLELSYSFAGSGALVQQITHGAPADVIATADAASMQKLVDAGLVDAPVTFARNRLQILVEPGNPKGITSVADLARSDVVFVTEDESVPAGKYAAAMFAAAGVTPNPVSKEPDVKSAVAKVTSGEADATVVYVTDVRAVGPKGLGIDLPDAVNQVATYPIAMVKATTHRDAALAFIASIVTGTGQDALRSRGFLAPA